MWQDMFVNQIPPAEKIIRTVVVYATIVVLFRLSGKRGLAQLNTFDFVVIFLLSNVVQNAIIGEDQSLVGGLIGAATLVGVNTAVDRLLARSDRVSRFIEGTPTTVIEHGQLRHATVRRLGIRPAELDHAIRTQHGDSLADVERGLLEPNGYFVLTLKPGEQTATKNDVEQLKAQLVTVQRALTDLASRS